MNRLWSRVGVRAASVGLLLAGLVGGVHLGKDREVKRDTVATADASVVDVSEMQLLKQRQGAHAFAGARQDQAEGNAAMKAAAMAKAAAGRAEALETVVLAARKIAAAQKKAAKIGGPVPYTGPIPGSCNDYSGSRAIGCTLMLSAGFDLEQFPCLDKLWAKESGWNYRAANRGSGAYGIPQALPGKKMSSVGADWRTNPATQIKWGLGYIKGRYRSPCGAWNNSVNFGSY